MKEDQFPKTIPIKGRVRICLELVKEQNIKNKVVVDIGSSFGWLEKEMVNMGAKKIIGVERDRAAVEFAKKKVKGANFLVSDASSIPLPENMADVVILYDVIEHVPKDIETQVFNEVNRILKKGGILLLSTPNQHVLSNLFDIAWYFGHRHYSKKTVTRMLKGHGFKMLTIVSKGSIFSSIYLTWFYIAKRLQKTLQPKSTLFEQLDDKGYQGEGITDIFLVARKS